MLKPRHRRVLSRRRFLGGGVGLLGGGLLSRCTPNIAEDCTLEPATPRSPPTRWLSGARVAGLEVYLGEPTCELVRGLDALADQHVSVVEVDSDLSDYLDAATFQALIGLLDRVARGCQLRGMRAVAYCPLLEVLTPNAASTPHTMAKDHPDWVQLSLSGDPNTFIGSAGSGIFWVDEGTESAWMCPTSGYRDYLLARVASLAGTALDGLWGDVPLLSDLEGIWPCVNPSCRAKFLADTGLAVPDEDNPKSAVWDDHVWRRWARWRHQLLWELEQDLCKTAKAVRGDFEVIIETVTMDYGSATCQGLDGAFADDGQVHRVWEVDAASDGTSMRSAAADDWISMAVMMRHARGCASPRPSWVFCYGLEPDDAEQVMGLAVAAGLCPYETKIPLMNTSVGADYRRRVFGWLEAQRLDECSGLGRAAVLYSSASRDFLDRAVRSVGLYTSRYPADKQWWSSLAGDSARNLPYVGDYRGCCKALIHAHVPYDVITTPHLDAAELSRVRLLVAPSPFALDDRALSLLQSYVSGGGTLLLTGVDGGKLDELGTARTTAALPALLGLDPTVPGWTKKALGQGRLVYSPARAGLAYYNTDDAAVLAEVIAAAADTGSVIVTTAPKATVMDLRRGPSGELVLVCANLAGLGTAGLGQYTPRDASFSVSLELAGETVARVTRSDPAAGAAADHDVPFTTGAGRVTFELGMRALCCARVHLR